MCIKFFDLVSRTRFSASTMGVWGVWGFGGGSREKKTKERRKGKRLCKHWMLRKANIKAFMNKVQLKYSGHRSKTQIYSYANVTDYHFLHAFDFPHLDHLCAVAQLPQTSQIVSCCLNSHWLHCVVRCGRLHPLQLAKQTTNISFQIGFSSLPSLHSRDGERARRRQEKV